MHICDTSKKTDHSPTPFGHKIICYRQSNNCEEVKGEDKLNDPDVIAKKKRGIQYCEVSSRWGKANGYKQWRYLFIPSKQVLPNSSFMQLTKQFDL